MLSEPLLQLLLQSEFDMPLWGRCAMIQVDDWLISIMLIIESTLVRHTAVVVIQPINMLNAWWLYMFWMAVFWKSIFKFAKWRISRSLETQEHWFKPKCMNVTWSDNFKIKVNQIWLFCPVFSDRKKCNCCIHCLVWSNKQNSKR